MVWLSIWNRLVLATCLGDMDMMLLFSSKEESLFLASCVTYAFCNIIDCLFELLCSSWKLDSGGMVGSSVGLFLMFSGDFSVLVHNILLTSVLSISICI